MKELKSSEADGFDIELQPFYITGNDIPEILEIKAEKVAYLEEAEVQVSIYQYDSHKEEWAVSLQKGMTEMEATYRPIIQLDISWETNVNSL
ncbi:hypothetical protein [Pontibacillus salipaludis]|uniref:Uncharacterized protein n=1 Tax=Pontibacillus salipaludis TaxID=1697394 RepID=A0ABQ1Q2B9_9BACI|nr:hypothetical protein [Pontibacillus salipaludis]GGD10021.1 hypothetical protein GCM10011389_16940 [Pontibacillus salipaludis]